MKILIIGPIPIEYGGLNIGGIATHNYGLINKLINSKHNVTIWYHNKYNSFSKIPFLTIIPFKIIYLFDILSNLNLVFDKKFGFLNLKEKILLCYQVGRLKKILKSNKFDAIHVHSLHNTSSLAIKIIGGISDSIPLIITDHGFWQSKLMSIKKIKKNCDRATNVVYISDYAFEHILKYRFVDNNKLIKIPNPINYEKIEFQNQKKTNKKILFFNGLSESVKRKGLDVLLDSLNSDKNLAKNIKLIALVNEKGKELITKRKLYFEVEIKSGMPWGEVREIYTKSDLMVLPSKSESFGLVYIESLMFGLPVVGFNKVIDEFKKKFTNYIGESYCPLTDNYIDLAEKINLALSIPINKIEVSKEVYDFYSWDNSLVCFLEIYNTKRVTFNN